MMTYANEDMDVTTSELEPVEYKDIEKHIKNMYYSIDGLNSYCDHLVGMESIPSFLKDIKVFFVDAFDKFIAAFKDITKFLFGADIKNPLPEYKNFDKASKEVGPLLKELDKKGIKPYKIEKLPYIKGCNLRLVEVSIELLKPLKGHLEVVKSALRSADSIISDGLSNKEVRESKARITLNKDLQTALEWNKKVMFLSNIMIKEDDYSDNKDLNSIMPFEGENIKFINNMNEIRKAISYKELTNINNVVKSVAEKADVLIKAIKDGEYVVSKEFVIAMQDSFTLVGDTVSYLATYYYLISQTLTAYNYLPVGITDRISLYEDNNKK